MTTALDIITLDLRETGIVGQGQTAAAQDVMDGLDRLNAMMAQWQRKRWLVYHLVDASLAMTGAQSYTIGAGGQFNVARPDRLEAAYVRQVSPAAPNQPDFPCEIIQSREAYNFITLKQLGSLPRFVFYDSDFPLGRIFPWPLPSNLYELHLSLKATLQTFPTLTTVFNLPLEYGEAIKYNLRLRTYAAYPALDGSPEVARLAKSALETIKNANAQIPVLRMPAALGGGQPYSIYSDN